MAQSNPGIKLNFSLEISDNTVNALIDGKQKTPRFSTDLFKFILDLILKYATKPKVETTFVPLNGQIHIDPAVYQQFLENLFNSKGVASPVHESSQKSEEPESSQKSEEPKINPNEPEKVIPENEPVKCPETAPSSSPSPTPSSSSSTPSPSSSPPPSPSPNSNNLMNDFVNIFSRASTQGSVTITPAEMINLAQRAAAHFSSQYAVPPSSSGDQILDEVLSQMRSPPFSE